MAEWQTTTKILRQGFTTCDLAPQEMQNPSKGTENGAAVNCSRLSREIPKTRAFGAPSAPRPRPLVDTSFSLVKLCSGPAVEAGCIGEL